MAKNETPAVDPMIAALEEAEWTSGAGRPKKESPYLGIVKHANEQGKAFAINVTLNGKNGVERAQDLSKHIMAFRKAGSQMEPQVTVLVQAGEVDENTGDVRITFKTREKITRNRSQEAVASAPAAANTNG